MYVLSLAIEEMLLFLSGFRLDSFEVSVPVPPTLHGNPNFSPHNNSGKPTNKLLYSLLKWV